MMVKMKRIKLTVLGSALAICFGAGLALLPSGTVAEAAFSGPSYEGYAQRITEESTAVQAWVPNYPEIPSSDYNFSEAGASLKLPDSVTTGVAEVNLTGAELGETILQFTASLEAKDKWNFVVFRGDAHYNSFTALMFRADGVITMMSHAYDADKAAETPNNPYIWYSYADLPEAPNAIFPEPVEKNCEIATGITALSSAGSTVDMTIISTKENVEVYIGDGETPVYESPLTIPLASAAGIFVYDAPNYCNSVNLTNLRCYDSLDYQNWNNAVTEDSLLYSAYGGGGAESTFGENGATLSAGSSIGNTAVFTMPDIENRTTVHTYSFTLNNSDTTYWSDMLLRANDDMSEYLVLRVRRMGQHVGLYGRIAGKNYTYSTEPFSGTYKDDFTGEYNDNDYVMCFPLGAGSSDFAKGTQLNFMIVTDNDGCTVYNNGSVFYSVDFNACKGYNPNTWDLSDEIAKLKPAVGTFGGDTSDLFAINTYSDATTVFSNVNCYYSGEKGVDTQKDTFLNGISYKGNLLAGFTPGSFESDIIVSGEDAFDRNSLTFEKGIGVTEVKTEWHTDEKFGYEQAIITVISEIATRTYILTFETYDEPVPFEREDWDELNEKNSGNQGGQTESDGGDTDAGCGSFVVAEMAVFCMALLAGVSIYLTKKGEKR